jgi:hypothetical protein
MRIFERLLQHNQLKAIRKDAQAGPILRLLGSAWCESRCSTEKHPDSKYVLDDSLLQRAK